MQINIKLQIKKIKIICRNITNIMEKDYYHFNYKIDQNLIGNLASENFELKYKNKS